MKLVKKLVWVDLTDGMAEAICGPFRFRVLKDSCRSWLFFNDERICSFVSDVPENCRARCQFHLDEYLALIVASLDEVHVTPEGSTPFVAIVPAVHSAADSTPKEQD